MMIYTCGGEGGVGGGIYVRMFGFYCGEVNVELDFIPNRSDKWAQWSDRY